MISSQSVDLDVRDLFFVGARVGAFVAGGVLLLGCGRSREAATTAPSAPSASVDVAIVLPAQPTPSPKPLHAQWMRDDAGTNWIRSEGSYAPPLVLHGVVHPTGAAIYPTGCMALFGARQDHLGVITAEGPPRLLHVFVKARGPLGIHIGEECKIVPPGTWAAFDLTLTKDGAEVIVADADVPGERRGQTSPYVIVVKDDAAAPTDEPDARPLVDPSAVTVRWALHEMKCAEASGNAVCYTAAIELGGAFKKTLPLKQRVTGQQMCVPNDTGILCGGASGTSNLSLTLAKDGTLVVSEYAESDGYCPPPEDCGSKTIWAKFKLPSDLHLVPDPQGTFPPP